MNWISVQERLPEDKQKIVFKGVFPYKCKGFFEINESGSHFYNLVESTGKIYSIYGVTHWMELPEKPT